MARQRAGSSSDAISQLPAELLADIIKELPLYDICRARRLSKHIKNVIDTNQSAILRPLMNAQKARIKSDFKILHCKTKSDLRTAFQAFLDYYGVNSVRYARWNTAFKFFSSYMAQNYRGTENGITVWTIVGCVALCGDLMSDSAANTQTRDSGISMLAKDAFKAGELGLSQQIGTLRGLSVPTTSSRCPVKDGLPRFYLTNQIPYADDKVLKDDSLCLGLCESVVAMLGLPTMRPCRRSAYCTKSHAMWALASRSWQSGGKKLSLFEQAALLEDIFIW